MSSNDELKYFHGDKDNAGYYRDQATKVEYPAVDRLTPETVANAQEPRRVQSLKKDEIRDLKLEEALRTALLNAEIVRDNAQFMNSGNRLLSNPDFATSIYDVAIQETNTLFGQGGSEAALSEFDPQFTLSSTWGRTEQAAESANIGFQPFDEQDTEFADARANLSKIFGNGGSVALSHNIYYTGVNQSGFNARPFASQYGSRPGAAQEIGSPSVGLEYRQPILAGAGTEYTRVAGPIARRPTLQSTPNVNQGVVIARIRTDITIASFEESIATLLKDVEDNYWELYLAYRTYDAEMVSMQSALQTWREVRANMDAGKVGAADEAQARDNFFEIKTRSVESLNRLFQSELRLRRLMGMAVNDGSVLRPSDDPVTARILPDWNVALTEALVNRPELRQQKWNVKSLELQYGAAKSLTRPRLDFVARYEVNGLGDKLTGQYNDRYNSFYGSLVDGQQTGWGLGFEFSMPIGFRGALSQVQNIEHRVTKARSVMAQQEQEISYEMAAVFQSIDQQFSAARTNFNRRRAAERRVQAFEAEYKVGRTTLDLLLRAQISLAQAEIAYYSSIAGYNRALADLKFRKGTILVDNNVYLAEGMWTGESYGDSLRRAWERSFSFDNPRLRTEPDEFVMEMGDYTPSSTAPPPGGFPSDVPSEELPAPAPAVPPAPDAKSAFVPGSELPASEDDFLAPISVSSGLDSDADFQPPVASASESSLDVIGYEEQFPAAVTPEPAATEPATESIPAAAAPADYVPELSSRPTAPRSPVAAHSQPAVTRPASKPLPVKAGATPMTRSQLLGQNPAASRQVEQSRIEQASAVQSNAPDEVRHATYEFSTSPAKVRNDATTEPRTRASITPAWGRLFQKD